MISSARRSAQRVLVYRLGSLGDTVIALPVLHLAARAYPEAKRWLLTSFPPNEKAPASSAVLDNTGLIHGYLRYSYGTRKFTELVALWWRILRWRPQVLIYMGGPRGVSSAKRDALFFRLCGIWHLIGIPDHDDLQQYRRAEYGRIGSPFTPGLPLEHECARLARSLITLGDAHLDDPSSWDLRITDQERKRALEVLVPVGGRPFFAISLGTKNQSNEWGLENWSAMLSRLRKLYPTYALVICGASVEFEACETVSADWRASEGSIVVNLCGVLSPRESAAVFKGAELFIGHDSGPMHLAASVQTPCIGIFSGRNLPSVWFPYGLNHHVIYHHVDCEGCGLQTCIVQKKKCILSITVDEVLTQIALGLETKKSKHDRA